MSGPTQTLYLDERQVADLTLNDDRPDYPPLTAEERRILKVVAEGICVSQSELQWCFYEAINTDIHTRFKRLRERLMSKKVELVVTT